MDVMMIDPRATQAAQIPHVEQYNGVWAMFAPAFEAIAAQIRRMDLQRHMQAAGAASREDKGYTLTGRVAVIDIVGMLTKYGTSLSGNPGTLRLRNAVRHAVSDPIVSAIMLRIDSPGGTSHGIDDLAADVAAAARRKPVHAFIEDMGASAAYYVASQATRLTANASAVVGSIGTYLVVEDWSAFFDEAGVKVHVVKAGRFKGAGTLGTAIDADQLASFQRFIDQTNETFLAAVAAGRRLSPGAVLELADGDVRIGRHAVAVNLVDAVETWDAALSAAQAAGDKEADTEPARLGRSVSAPDPRPLEVQSREDWAANVDFEGAPVRRVFGSESEFLAYLQAKAAGRIGGRMGRGVS